MEESKDFYYLRLVGMRVLSQKINWPINRIYFGVLLGEFRIQKYWLSLKMASHQESDQLP